MAWWGGYNLMVVAGLFAILYWRINRERKQYDELTEPFEEMRDRIHKKHGIESDEVYGSDADRYTTLKLLDEINDRLKKIEEKLN